jgi:hypothetical protein
MISRLEQSLLKESYEIDKVVNLIIKNSKNLRSFVSNAEKKALLPEVTDFWLRQGQIWPQPQNT